MEDEVRMRVSKSTLFLFLGLFILIFINFSNPGKFNSKLDSNSNSDNKISFKNEVFRNLFFGHQTFADQLQGIRIMAATIDLYTQTPAQRISVPNIPKQRFDSLLPQLKTIALHAVYMPESFVFPALYTALEDENPKAALPIIELGLISGKKDPRLLLLGAFISHVFLRDINKAAQFYREISKLPKAPAWSENLAKRMESGQDPLDTEPELRKSFCIMIRNSFPRAKQHFEPNGKFALLCQKEIQKP